MWHLTLRDVVAHRARFALTLLAVVLAVTFVSGSLLLTDTSDHLLDEQFGTAAAGVDLTVRDAAVFGAAMGVEVDRDPLGPDVVDRVRSVEAVDQVMPVAEGQGLLEVDGEAVVPSGASVLTSWAPEPFGAFAVREGRAPAAAGEVVLDVATATAAGVGVGDTVAVLTDLRTDLEVVGLAGFGDADGLPGATIAMVTLDDAQRMLELGDGVSELRVTAADGASVPDVLAAVRQALGDDYDVATAQDTAAASADAAKEQLGSLGLVLTAMSAAAVLVGGLLIANTFAIVTSQRRRELALLRAAGATSGQVTRAVLGEAVLIGVLGGVLGAALGVLAAGGLRSVMAAFGLPLPEGVTVVSASSVVVSVVLGLVVTVVSAVGAARRAARVAPVEALRASVDLAGGRTSPSRARRALRGVPLALGLAGVAAVVAGAPVMVLVPAAVATVVGLALLGPVLMPSLARLVGAPLLRTGVTGHLARESAARAPRRTTSTAMALALGLALIAFMTVVATSLREGMTGTYRETVTADLVVESARAEMLGGLSTDVAHHVGELPEVAAMSRLRYGHWLDGGQTSALSAIDPATLAEVTDLDMVAGSLDALADGGVVVAASVAEERGLEVGDTVTMTFSYTGDQRLPVVGVLDSVDAQALSTGWFVSLDTYAAHFTEDLDASVFVRAADGVPADEVRAAVEGVLADHPTAAVRDQAAAAEARGATVDQVLGLVTVLLVLTVVIALLGITNTLALSVAERTREIGLLRAVGGTRRQIGAMVRSEAVLVAAIAGALGLALGVGLGAATVTALGRSAPLAIALPAGRLAVVLVVAVVAGLVAGLAPSRRAARMDVLQAIATH
ncbi:FtsX-like permease family protein [Actinotalea ferrariae]|uniref:FtsX-like permease family protein n=1 Tax=Actinotalea ferrariae TaxID=1386098 RepID=UPI001C8B7CDB|nr:FtsX-like permease family protein [Actinotalea ferrariae]MBX9245618.1 FtsX-like permease family protein [Actinotalea ferrariae]